jgi:heme exporter protein B
MSAWALFEREWCLAMQRKSEILTVLFFFVLAVSLFPLALGPEPRILRATASGIVWVCALMSCLMSLPRLFQPDVDDGSWDQLRTLGASPLVIVGTKMAVHWLQTGVPLMLLAPVMALQFGLSGQEIVMLVTSLLLGTPSLSLIGGVGAALTVNLRGSQALVALLVLPLCIPVLIFGVGAIETSQVGLSAQGHLSLLGAIFLLMALGAPWVVSRALLISTE